MLKKLLSILYCLSLLLVGCTRTEQRFGIVFTANLNGNQDIYRTQSTDFQKIEQLTFTPLDEEKLLKISSEGDRLLFYVPAPSPERIMAESLTSPDNYPHTYIYDLKVKTSIDIDFPLGVKTPVLPQDWASDDNKVLFSGGDTNKVYTVNVSTKDVQEFNIPVSEGAYPVEISYSPDGKQIAYTENSNFSGGFHLVVYTPFIYDFESQTTTRIGDGLVDCWNPQWSPIGSQILLNCNLSTDGWNLIFRNRLFDVSFNGDTIITRQIAELPCSLAIAWSPTGKQFASYCKKNDNPVLTIFSSDGSIYKEIPIGSTDHPIIVQEIAWSPDGQQILYIAGKDENSLSINIINSDGSNNRVITTQPSNYSELSVYSIGP